MSDMTSHWQAIARVLVYGYVRKNYFPIHLSQAFVAATLFGEESISSEFTFHSFQLYMSCEEKETLLAALAGNLPLDDEDLWDVLSNYKCYRRITMDNITQTVNELAQKDFLKSTIIFSRSTTKSLAGNDIGRFLAFFTASDVITCRNICVSFVDVVGAACRPVVHICGPPLELPSTYHSCKELVEEFNCVVKNALSRQFNIV